MFSLFKLEIDERRIFGLDILRAFAILFVLLQHGAHLLPEKLKYYNRFLVFDGVSIFFVLSGFLIGGILIKTLEKEKERNISFKILFNFWKRRWFRTLPAYFFILLLLCLIWYLNSNFSIKGIIILTHNYFIFSQNLISNHPWFFPEAWSLSVEEWFYLITPFLIILLIIKLKVPVQKSILLVAVLILLGTTLIRFIKFESLPVLNYDEWDLAFRKEVFTRLDSLMYGIIGAYCNFYFHDKWKANKKLFLWAGIFLLAMIRYIIPVFHLGRVYNSVFSFSLMSLSILFFLPYFSNFKKGQGAFYKAITYLSLISYSMYLINYSLVQGWIIHAIPWSQFFNANLSITVQYISYWLLTILLSILLFKYFELPFTNLRDRNKLKLNKSKVPGKREEFQEVAI